MLGVEFVMCRLARVDSMLLEGMRNGTDSAAVDGVIVGTGQHGCSGWNVLACTHPGSVNNKQDRVLGGDGHAWSVTPMARKGLHDLKLHKNAMRLSSNAESALVALIRQK